MSNEIIPNVAMEKRDFGIVNINKKSVYAV